MRYLNYLRHFSDEHKLEIKILAKMLIPAISAIQSGGSRPPVPIEVGHLNRSKVARYRSEATLVFDKSQIICFESNQFSFFA
jgi:hypothetical protein